MTLEGRRNLPYLLFVCGVSALGGFLFGHAFPWLLETLGGAGAFLVFACMCVPAILIAWRPLPETRGKTLEEMERFWLHGARAQRS